MAPRRTALLSLRDRCANNTGIGGGAVSSSGAMIAELAPHIPYFVGRRKNIIVLAIHTLTYSHSAVVDDRESALGNDSLEQLRAIDQATLTEVVRKDQDCPDNDAHRRNLMWTRSQKTGQEELIGIDRAFAGIGALGYTPKPIRLPDLTLFLDGCHDTRLGCNHDVT